MFLNNVPTSVPIPKFARTCVHRTRGFIRKTALGWFSSEAGKIVRNSEPPHECHEQCKSANNRLPTMFGTVLAMFVLADVSRPKTRQAADRANQSYDATQHIRNRAGWSGGGRQSSAKYRTGPGRAGAGAHVLAPSRFDAPKRILCDSFDRDGRAGASNTKSPARHANRRTCRLWWRYAANHDRIKLWKDVAGGLNQAETIRAWAKATDQSACCLHPWHPRP